MIKLYLVTCNGMFNSTDVYVLAKNEAVASNKALNELIEKDYNKVNKYVSNVKLIADKDETNDCLLVL